MTLPAPEIDPRTAADVEEQVKALLKQYVPAYSAEPGELGPDPLRDALIGIFGRFAELIIERLNQVPDKNFLAFLDLLGASRLPPQPARVPLTFLPAAGSVVPGVVPPGTQAAAAPGPGEKDPTIFETERELVVTPALLTAVFTRDPKADAYGDYSALTREASLYGVPLFRGDRPQEHILYLGLAPFLEFEGITLLTLDFTIATPVPADPRETLWEHWDGTGWVPLPLQGSDATGGLRHTGQLRILPIPVVPLSVVGQIESRWLRCRLLTPILRSAVPRLGMVRESQIRAVLSVVVDVTVDRSGRPVDAAFTNQTPIDISKDFFPFGEIPRFGDTFWLRADEVFSKTEASVTLRIKMNHISSKASRNPTLAWEMWDGSQWQRLGTSSPAGSTPASFVDTSKAFTDARTLEHTVTFPTPQQTSSQPVNGVEGGFWLRVRLISGDYGQDAHYVSNGELEFVPADVDPPIIAQVKLDYTLSRSGSPDPLLAYNDFSFTRTIADVAPVPPFRASEDERPTAYLGFELPAPLTAFPNRPVSLFARAADLRYGEPTVPLSPVRSRKLGVPGASVTHTFVVTNASPLPARVSLAILGIRWTPVPTVPETLDLLALESVQVEVAVTIPPTESLGGVDLGLLAVAFSTEPGFRHLAAFATLAANEPPAEDPVELAWEYWNGVTWSPLLVADDSDHLARSGSVEFLAPPQLAAREDFGAGPRYWIRAGWKKGDYANEPRLGRFLLNTTMASQTVTIAGESLGSSDGSKGQRFRAARKPVLPGQRLEVREAELPPAGERAVLEKEEGADAITTVLDAAGRLKERWVRWHEVPDFYGSGPRDRHYVLDRFTGEVRLGDGQNGLVPPIGTALRLLRYRTGGGSAGNRPAGMIVQLKTTVPYVDKVTNLEPAAGGADAEPMDSVLDRAPRSVRHSGRAVTLEDYEDLALLATPEVARAKCIPLANLAEDPLAVDPSLPGEVSVIIVPRSAEVKPLPSLELIRTVQDFLETVSVPTARATVVGPLYIRVNVDAVIAVASLQGATAVLAEVERTVTAFLHPLTGGLDGKGWDFGRQPHLSDLYALIEAVPGVDHVRSLDVSQEEDPLGAAATGRFLVYAGQPRIGLVLEEV